MLMLSGDIGLNPGLVYNHFLPNLKEWDIFKIKGIHLLHLNVINLLPKNDEVRYIGRLSNATVIVIKSKLDSYIRDSEIQEDNYQILRCDRNRKVGGVASYVRNDLSHIEKKFFHEEIENIFFEILLPKTRPITVGIIYRPLNQHNFRQTLNGNFAKLAAIKNELYIIKIKYMQKAKAMLLCGRHFLMMPRIIFIVWLNTNK